MDHAVDSGDGDGLIGEDLVPGAERLVGRDGEASGFVAPGDQFEEHGALGTVLLRVGDVVEDDQVELVELGEGGLERQVAPRGLKPLHHVPGAGAEDMGFAHARVADGNKVGACINLDQNQSTVWVISKAREGEKTL